MIWCQSEEKDFMIDGSKSKREEQTDHDSQVSGLGNTVDGGATEKRKEGKRNGRFRLWGLMNSL